MDHSFGNRNLRLALAGLQAGCLGTLLMIGSWMLGTGLDRGSPWRVPNLIATTFYGRRTIHSGFSFATTSGIALTVVLYFGAGVAFALVGREKRTGLILLFAGVVAGLVLDWALFAQGLSRLSPTLAPFLPNRLIWLSHVLYGLALGRYPEFLRTSASPPPLP